MRARTSAGQATERWGCQRHPRDVYAAIHGTETESRHRSRSNLSNFEFERAVSTSHALHVLELTGPALVQPRSVPKGISNSEVLLEGPRMRKAGARARRSTTEELLALATKQWVLRDRSLQISDTFTHRGGRGGAFQAQACNEGLAYSCSTLTGHASRCSSVSSPRFTSSGFSTKLHWQNKAKSSAGPRSPAVRSCAGRRQEALLAPPRQPHLATIRHRHTQRAVAHCALVQVPCSARAPSFTGLLAHVSGPRAPARTHPCSCSRAVVNNLRASPPRRAAPDAAPRSNAPPPRCATALAKATPLLQAPPRPPNPAPQPRMHPAPCGLQWQCDRDGVRSSSLACQVVATAYGPRRLALRALQTTSGPPRRLMRAPSGPGGSAGAPRRPVGSISQWRSVGTSAGRCCRPRGRDQRQPGARRVARPAREGSILLDDCRGHDRSTLCESRDAPHLRLALLVEAGARFHLPLDAPLHVPVRRTVANEVKLGSVRHQRRCAPRPLQPLFLLQSTPLRYRRACGVSRGT